MRKKLAINALGRANEGRPKAKLTVSWVDVPTVSLRVKQTAATFPLHSSTLNTRAKGY